MIKSPAIKESILSKRERPGGKLQLPQLSQGATKNRYAQREVPIKNKVILSSVKTNNGLDSKRILCVLPNAIPAIIEEITPHTIPINQSLCNMWKRPVLRKTTVSN